MSEQQALSAAKSKAKTKAKQEKKLSLAEKMCAVQGEATGIEKGGYNDFHKYSYSQESDILEVISPLLHKYRIAFKYDVRGIERLDSDVWRAEVVCTLTG